MALQIVDTDTGEIREDDQDRLPKYQHYGTCRFCGQHGIVDTDEEDTDQRTVDEYVTMHCTCQGAEEYQERMAKLAEAKDNLQEITKNVNPKITEAMTAGLDLIGCGAIQEMQVKIGRKTLKVQIKTKGSILVQMTETTRSALEA
jgi:hypothetical protein